MVSTSRADFYIFKSSVLVFSRNPVFWFLSIVNSGCSAYLSVDHSLIYRYTKMCLIFFSLILLEPNSKLSFSVHLLVSFCFCSGIYLMKLGSCHQLSPACKSYSSIFNSQSLLYRLRGKSHIDFRTQCIIIT